MVEGVDLGIMEEVEDVDKVEGCGVQKVMVDREARDVWG